MGDATGRAYALLGIALSLAGLLVALTRVRTQTRRRARRSSYAADVYHMTARSHRRFAALSAVCAAGFALALRWPVIEVPLLAAYVLALVLYLSSFARGFADEDE